MHNHIKSKRKLSREKGPRELMFRNLATSIILHEKVKTTLSKAKEVRPMLERLITTAKKGDLLAKRKLQTYLLDSNAIQKLLVEIAPLYKERDGGYTRITRLEPRAGDGAEMAMIELLDIDNLIKKPRNKKTETKKEDSKERNKKKKVSVKGKVKGKSR